MSEAIARESESENKRVRHGSKRIGKPEPVGKREKGECKIVNHREPESKKA